MLDVKNLFCHATLQTEELSPDSTRGLVVAGFLMLSPAPCSPRLEPPRGGLARNQSGGDVLDADTLDPWRTVTTEAAAHARCGPKAKCRVDAAADVDALLDTISEMDVRGLRDVGAGAVTGG